MSARMQVSLSDDGRTASLAFLEASGQEGEITLSLDQLTQLIASLGAVRRAMVENTPPPPIEGVPVVPVFRTNWAIQPEALTEGSLIAFQHPAYGPIGLALAPDDARRVVQALTRHQAMIHPSGRTRPS
ncbi:conserved hypothetical protein [Gluconacetobacter diazotrophicus PA1 5]|uniref:Uncharacterized protein n=1 Tax=Gluconacetobacter diazotrophicus TaxID=33996 RepID=A0A7W4NHD0_GLUDI|nr:hypothetical protein [Gluconacetobacter diazotrophicus]ACI51064.1 conserved hypothetical protein [Gluconacetobacter diazotrophicus PA1 5]MBB2157767.1 hypothetical protein [Gluconacetobacter diazotrophicus]TWB00955.1 hypothetical protein FBZ86_1328 [Gluconacetobacter diazotrophicus]